MLHKLLFSQRPYILLEKMMDSAALSQRVISANVANVSTPGYERIGVDFDHVLKRMVESDKTMKRTDPRHIPGYNWHENIKPEIVKIEDGYWNGVNNVNMDEEMVELAKVQLDFSIATRLMNLRFTRLRTAIRGRR